MHEFFHLARFILQQSFSTDGFYVELLHLERIMFRPYIQHMLSSNARI